MNHKEYNKMIDILKYQISKPKQDIRSTILKEPVDKKKKIKPESLLGFYKTNYKILNYSYNNRIYHFKDFNYLFLFEKHPLISGPHSKSLELNTNSTLVKIDDNEIYDKSDLYANPNKTFILKDKTYLISKYQLFSIPSEKAQFNYYTIYNITDNFSFDLNLSVNLFEILFKFTDGDICIWK